jgi:hypothetical protein
METKHKIDLSAMGFLPEYMPETPFVTLAIAALHPILQLYELLYETYPDVYITPPISHYYIVCSLARSVALAFTQAGNSSEVIKQAQQIAEFYLKYMTTNIVSIPIPKSAVGGVVERRIYSYIASMDISKSKEQLVPWPAVLSDELLLLNPSNSLNIMTVINELRRCSEIIGYIMCNDVRQQFPDVFLPKSPYRLSKLITGELRCMQIIENYLKASFNPRGFQQLRNNVLVSYTIMLTRTPSQRLEEIITGSQPNMQKWMPFTANLVYQLDPSFASQLEGKFGLTWNVPPMLVTPSIVRIPPVVGEWTLSELLKLISGYGEKQEKLSNILKRRQTSTAIMQSDITVLEKVYELRALGSLAMRTLLLDDVAEPKKRFAFCQPFEVPAAERTSHFVSDMEHMRIYEREINFQGIDSSLIMHVPAMAILSSYIEGIRWLVAYTWRIPQALVKTVKTYSVQHFSFRSVLLGVAIVYIPFEVLKSDIRGNPLGSFDWMNMPKDLTENEYKILLRRSLKNVSSSLELISAFMTSYHLAYSELVAVYIKDFCRSLGELDAVPLLAWIKNIVAFPPIPNYIQTPHVAFDKTATYPEATYTQHLWIGYRETMTKLSRFKSPRSKKHPVLPPQPLPSPPEPLQLPEPLLQQPQQPPQPYPELSPFEMTEPSPSEIPQQRSKPNTPPREPSPEFYPMDPDLQQFYDMTGASSYLFRDEDELFPGIPHGGTVGSKKYTSATPSCSFERSPICPPKVLCELCP